jgi:NADH:ubiquinone oxidoreductase subunit F (NADH-binding)
MTAVTKPTSDRLLAVTPGAEASNDLATHLRVHGPLRLPSRPDPAWRAELLGAIAESGLLGRGGAGFPAFRKWEASTARGRRPVVVVNAMEGEPASAKDRVLLTHAAHLVLDGAEVAAAVVRSPEIVVCVPDHSDAIAASVERAMAERAATGGTRRMSVRRPPGRFVTGEESALVGWLDGGAARPVLRVDKSVPLRIGRGPALVHNAETLAQVALIARHGPAWFRQVGTVEAPGTTLVTVTGAVRSPGVVEVEFGTSVADVLVRAGVAPPLGGVLVGGYGGAWLPAASVDTPYAPGPLAAAGATQGVGILVALPTTSCGVAETARMVRYLAGESAGQCGPCVFGLPAMADDLEQLWSGRTDDGVLDRLVRRADAIEGRGACRHPDGATRLVRSALRVFADDLRAHAAGRPCAGHAASTVLTFPGTGLGGRRAQA